MSELISLRDTAGSQQGRVFGRQSLARMMQTGYIHGHLCPGDLGVLHLATASLLLVLPGFIMIIV